MPGGGSSPGLREAEKETKDKVIMMLTVDELNEIIQKCAMRRYRLLILINDDSNKFARNASIAYNYHLINLNLELSKILLSIEKIDYLIIKEKVEGIIGNNETSIVTNFELLFDKHLSLMPLKLFCNLSINRTIVLVWPGKYSDSKLFYSEPGHIDYFEESATDILILDMRNGGLL